MKGKQIISEADLRAIQQAAESQLPLLEKLEAALKINDAVEVFRIARQLCGLEEETHQ